MGRGYQLSHRPQAIFAPRDAPGFLRKRPDGRGNVTCFPIPVTTLHMKKLTLLGALALFAVSSGAQSPVPADQKQLEALMKAVQAQQAQMADNQAKIDAKLETLAEAIRVARLYSSRGG